MLTKNEHDDGRPILYQQKPASSRVISVLGGKIDNIYDLFEILGKANPGNMQSSAHKRNQKNALRF